MSAVVHLQSGYILQHRPYRESSLLLEVFTADHGLVPMLAKGVRKEKSRMAGVLLPFTQLSFSYLDRHELKTLIRAEYLNNHDLQRLALYCGFYVNELLQKFLHKHDSHPQLFVCYQHCLQRLAAQHPVEEVLRYFELQLLRETGYGVQLDVDCRSGQTILADQRYDFIAAEGLSAAVNGMVSAQTLTLLAAGAPLDAAALQEAKQLLRRMLDTCLQGQSLHSRDVLSKIIKYL